MEKIFKIYTKTGDDGTSGLIGGTRVEKFDSRLEAYGTVDELNSWIGLIRTSQFDDETNRTLEMIQNKLFVIGSHLATDISKTGKEQRIKCNEEDILSLENEIDRLQQILPPLSNFILPGGSKDAANCHIARTVCRRAERRVTLLSKDSDIENLVVKFINRLSDYLFVLSRYINHLQKHSETIWIKPKS